MPTYREYSARLASMGGMRRVTSTMKMVAASHLHRAQLELRRSQPYGQRLAGLLQSLQPQHAHGHRLLTAPRDVRNALLIVVTSNRGLCGGYNGTICRAARRWLETNRPRFKILRATFLGRKGHMLLHGDVETRGEPFTMPAHPAPREALRIGRPIGAAFADGRYDEVYLAFNRFVSPMVSKAEIERVLPIQVPPRPADVSSVLPDLYEPRRDVLLDEILLQWFDFRLFEAMQHSVAGEHAARVVAMENATANLRRLESELTLLRNRARQAAITKELAEIVGGADALA